MIRYCAYNNIINKPKLFIRPIRDKQNPYFILNINTAAAAHVGGWGGSNKEIYILVAPITSSLNSRKWRLVDCLPSVLAMSDCNVIILVTDKFKHDTWYINRTGVWNRNISNDNIPWSKGLLEQDQLHLHWQCPPYQHPKRMAIREFYLA